MAEIALWRLVRNEHAGDPFSGEGARLFGGRWNSKGTAVSYLADSPALCQLEVLANTQDYRALANFTLFQVRVSDTHIETLAKSDWPDGWNARPPALASKRIGDDWAREERSLLLRVPSVLDAHGANFLLNPRHPDWPELEIGEGKPYPIDERLTNW